MPTYSATTDLNCWFAICLIEHWEGMDSDDKKIFRNRVIEDVKEEGMAQIVDFCDLPQSFVSATQHSVDWDYVLERFVYETDEDDDEDDDEERQE